MNVNEMVTEFHKLFDVPLSKQYTLDSDRVHLRIELIREEVKEFVFACDDSNLVEIADALADIVYVCYGAALEFGIKLDDVIREVHRSNMTKVWPDGTVHKRSDGKVLKPDTYSKADVKGVLGL